MRSSTDDSSPPSLHRATRPFARSDVGDDDVADRAVIVDDPAAAAGTHVEVDAGAEPVREFSRVADRYPGGIK